MITTTLAIFLFLWLMHLSDTRPPQVADRLTAEVIITALVIGIVAVNS